MPGISLVGVHSAGGLIEGPLQSLVYVNGSPVAVAGDSVTGHPPCPQVSSHCNPTMAQGSSLTRINGKPVCRAGDAATCGHAATGLGWVVDGG